MTLRMIFSIQGFNRLTAFATGAAGGYAFTNPDVDNVYDLFPLHKPPPFAFLNVYKVKEEDSRKFEEEWKELAKFNQRQEGYLFTKFMKADPRDAEYGKRVYDYIDITQWTTGDAQRRASLRTGYQELEEALPGERLSAPMMFSVVVDDSQAVGAVSS
eukprot:TRINITY_DN86201_c0_g1_i1.p1 TRINITY_DN86201_c0_g1~~TRINITY_DN86201_c0_g1_i1.p1  ORF type:complete len:158 (-),score=44.44 TRINITY_DN86201_c0_g1_i1:115-588(-)